MPAVLLALLGIGGLILFSRFRGRESFFKSVSQTEAEKLGAVVRNPDLEEFKFQDFFFQSDKVPEADLLDPLNIPSAELAAAIEKEQARIEEEELGAFGPGERFL